MRLQLATDGKDEESEKDLTHPPYISHGEKKCELTYKSGYQLKWQIHAECITTHHAI